MMEANFNEQVVLHHNRYEVDYDKELFLSMAPGFSSIHFAEFKADANGNRTIILDRGNHKPVADQSAKITGYQVKVKLPERVFQVPYMHLPDLVREMNLGGRKGNFRILEDYHRIRIDRGKLPVLEMAENDIWYFDGRLNELRNSQPPFNNISLDFMEKSADLKHHVMVYDLAQREEVKLDWRGAIELPDRYIFVSFPIREVFDPVGQARSQRIESWYFLTEQPGLAQYQAKVIPWHRTAIHEIIARNRKKQGLPELAKNRKGRTKGRGI